MTPFHCFPKVKPVMLWSILLGLTAWGQAQLSTPAKYEVLKAEPSQGAGFIIKYYEHLCGVTTLHQFGGSAPTKLVRAKGGPVALKATNVVKQHDVQTLLLVDEKSPIPYLPYQPKFALKPHEIIIIYDAGGKAVEASVDLLTFGIECNSLEGAKEVHAKFPSAVSIEGMTGSPVVQKSTGAVVGVLLGPVAESNGKIASFETLCLPDLSPQPAAKPAPVYTDPKQAAAYQNFLTFTKILPMVHWKTSDNYFKAFGQSGAPDTANDFTKKNVVTELEIKPASDGQWAGSCKLWDPKLPSEFWRYQFLLKDGTWVTTGGQKFIGASSLDLFTGDKLFQRAYVAAMKSELPAEKAK
jgi:hypothetical protein